MCTFHTILLQPSELYLYSTLLLTQDLSGKLSKLNIDHTSGFSKCARFPMSTLFGGFLKFVYG